MIRYMDKVTIGKICKLWHIHDPWGINFAMIYAVEKNRAESYVCIPSTAMAIDSSVITVLGVAPRLNYVTMYEGL